MARRRQAKKKKSISFIGALANLFGTLGAIVKEITEVAALEFEIAKRSLALILILTVIIIFLLISAWTLLLAVIGSALVSLIHLSWISVFSLLVLFNLLIIICLLLWIARARKRLTFPVTRSQLDFFKEVDYEKTHDTKTTQED